MAGLLSPEQLQSIFLNVEQLISVNRSFSAQLKEAVELAAAAGDDDLSSVDVGAIFLDSLSMLLAFEAYCTKQVNKYVNNYVIKHANKYVNKYVNKYLNKYLNKYVNKYVSKYVYK